MPDSRERRPEGRRPVPNPPNVSIEIYKQLVDQCARERLNYPIANGSAFHARILISKLFEIAKSQVAIISGGLKVRNKDGVEIYGDSNVSKNAKKFLRDPGAELTIIVQTGEIDQGRQNEFLRDIVNSEDRNGTVVLVTPNRNVLDFSVPHFMVSDASAYRLETGEAAHTDLDNITAIANFGDKPTAKALQDYFNDLKNLLAGENFGRVETFPPGEKLLA